MKLTDLRGILQYIPRFREKIFVISVDAAIVTSENFPNILLDVAVLRSLSIRVVLVHGAAAQIDLLAREQNVQASDLDGSGVTDAGTLKLALTASNRLTHEILEGLSANDLRAASCNALIAHPLGIIHGQDHLFTGKIERIDVEMLQALLGQGIIPVVPPLGFDGDGKTYRVNSDAVALEVAKSLNAAKLIFITTLDGLIYKGRLIQQILVSDLNALLTQDKAGFAPEIASKAQHASAACAAGISRVHVINGRVDEALLAEVFSNEGVGTLVHANEYQQIRRAMKKDVRAILTLTKNSVASEELVKRTRATLEKMLGDFYIFETDKNPVACVALHQLDQTKGELACLYVSPSHENQGIGRKLVTFVENKARELGLTELITLSTQAFTYFQSKGGFGEGSPDDLPPARREKYDQSGRNSKVLVKKDYAEMSRRIKFPAEARRACARHGIMPSRFFLAVSIPRQTTALFERKPGERDYKLVKTYRCSTSKFGIGEQANSNMTPRGLHRVAQKIGGGWPVGTAFKSRRVTGFTWNGQPMATITNRILWLEGMEPGFNKDGAVDTHARYVYIHGTGNETTLGRPDSHGCVHLSGMDLIPLYDLLPEGTLVWISEKQLP